jgi:hypothetical protein
MSKLGLHVRPVVLFDPSNKLHRQWVTKFIADGTWGGCPVRFAVADDHGNLLGHLQRELILWYAQQERRGKLATETKPGRRQRAGLTGGGFELTI